MHDRWGIKKARIGGESLKSFDQCALCLDTVQSPMACTEGHIFCKECVLTSVLEQKSSIAATKASLVKLAAQQEEEKAREREKARRKVLEDFERGVGFGHLVVGDRGEGSSSSTAAAAGSKRKEAPHSSPSNEASTSSASTSASATTSTLTSIPARAQSLALAAEERALATLEESQRASRKSKLPSFWLPSLIPSEREGDVDLRKLTEDLGVRCRVGSERGHPLSIKSLTEVKFATVQGGAGEGTGTTTTGAGKAKACPTCSKQLSQNTKLVLMRKCCGTVLCGRCFEDLVEKPAKKAGSTSGECPACAGKLKDLNKDVVALQREGTGFAGGGGTSEVTAKGASSFQG